jgi:hypothetical protein
MHNAIQQFRANLLSARELGKLAVAVTKITTTAIDVTDMWRAQIVLGVSALDYLIHELTRICIDRRNKIAHEADMDPTNPGFRWPIDFQMASDALNEIERVGEAIFKVATRPHTNSSVP